MMRLWLLYVLLKPIAIPHYDIIKWDRNRHEGDIAIYRRISLLSRLLNPLNDSADNIECCVIDMD